MNAYFHTKVINKTTLVFLSLFLLSACGVGESPRTVEKASVPTRGLDSWEIELQKAGMDVCGFRMQMRKINDSAKQIAAVIYPSDIKKQYKSYSKNAYEWQQEYCRDHGLPDTVLDYAMDAAITRCPE